MPTRSSQQHALTWENYERGRTGSEASLASASPVSSPTKVSPSATSGSRTIRNPSREYEENDWSRRRSPASTKFSSFRQVGGANSFENFARSWQRAAGFHEIAPLGRPSLVDDSDAGDEEITGNNERTVPYKSLLRQQLESAAGQSHVEEAIDDSPEDDPGGREGSQPVDRSLLSDAQPGIYSHLAALRSPLAHSFGTSYGTVTSRISQTSKRRATLLFQEQLADAQQPDKEREPLMLRQVSKQDGTTTNVIMGQSTLPQTVFNSVNTLIGVGLLSLPLGIKYAGWLVGLLFLVACTITTSYTAKILTVCLDVDPSLVTYADLAYVSFGSKARVATGLLFSLELIAACVALVVLFADSLHVLIPGWGVLEWKVFCGILLIPPNFAPLRVLSFSSILGILCCVGLVSVIIIDGIIKPHSPGSLRQPMTTNLFPEQWSTLPLSFGLLMSPWGGHSVFPSIYRDMRHPQKYGRSLRYTFSFTFGLDLSMAVFGLLMFGDLIRDEVTSNILLTKGYPRFLSILIVILIMVIPLTKIPLNCRPIIGTVEVLFGLDPRLLSPDSRLHGMSSFTRAFFKTLTRILVVVLIVVVAIALPDFDMIMALMGSALCFTICIVLPLAFYLKIFERQISLKERIVDWALILICSAMAIVGTVWAFLPKDKIGAKVLG